MQTLSIADPPRRTLPGRHTVQPGHISARTRLAVLAEGVGFEPTVPLLDTTVFETAPFGRSGIPPPTSLGVDRRPAGACPATAPHDRQHVARSVRRVAKNSREQRGALVGPRRRRRPRARG